jgi:hypothetical protein
MNSGYNQLKAFQDFGAIQLGEIRGNHSLDLRADVGIELVQQRIADLAAGGHPAAVDFRIFRQTIDTSGEISDKPFPFFQVDIVTFAVGHCAGGIRFSGAAMEAARHIRHFFTDSVVGLRLRKLLEGFESGASIGFSIFQFEGFQTSQVRQQN